MIIFDKNNKDIQNLSSIQQTKYQYNIIMKDGKLYATQNNQINNNGFIINVETTFEPHTFVAKKQKQNINHYKKFDKKINLK